MNITSVYFICFFIVLYILFYVIPKKYQWIILLLGSLFFYTFTGISNLVYILITSFSTYIATRVISNSSAKQKQYIKENKAILTKEERVIYKKKQKSIRKAIMISTIVLNFGLLCYFKYIHFIIDQINGIAKLFGSNIIDNSFSLVVPLGISFYTFQTMGYLVDVYWEESEAEHNYFKVLLFVCFFPQIIQGPISNYNQLSSELFKEHKFIYKNYVWGFQRVLWGFFKKLVIANTLSSFVADVFQNYSEYTGITVLIGAFMYSILIYADFSGYMDIVCGLCEMLDIKLSENFVRPYFSKSIAEYWRRWHITLGAWFKTYIYYPVATAKWNAKLSKKIKIRADVLPASIALIIVWFVTGLWHGASWAYIAWGGVNGMFIIFSLWMEPTYNSWKTKLHIQESNGLWKMFQVVRTFILVTFIKVLPEVGTLSEGVGLIKRIFVNHTIPKSFDEIFPYLDNVQSIYIIVIGTILMLIVSLLQRKQPVRYYINKIPVAIRIPALAICFIAIIYFGIPVSNGIQFMYAQF